MSANPAASMNRLRTYRLIRQIHIWIGAWGAIAAILYGFTGFVQNHRGVLKLPQGDSNDIAHVELQVPEAARSSPEAMRSWLVQDQHVAIDNQRVQPGRPVQFNGQKIPQPARWMFGGGNARITTQVDYSEGADRASLRTTQQSPLAILSRLHKGVGGGIGWILLGDSFALAMIMLGISGLLLWARGRNVGRVVVSILGAAVVVMAILIGMAIF